MTNLFTLICVLGLMDAPWYAWVGAAICVLIDIVVGVNS